ERPTDARTERHARRTDRVVQALQAETIGDQHQGADPGQPQGDAESPAETVREGGSYLFVEMPDDLTRRAGSRRRVKLVDVAQVERRPHPPVGHLLRAGLAKGEEE